VIVIMKRWRKRAPATATAAPAAAGVNGGIQVTPELLARARELAKRETED